MNHIRPSHATVMGLDASTCEEPRSLVVSSEIVCVSGHEGVLHRGKKRHPFFLNRLTSVISTDLNLTLAIMSSKLI